ncbi:zinc-dependent metalloprotease [Flexithrix dorotheae]|uniref:zinc-dependent metalloprotease n=1 Tax=Flexithrix dorotheae TaxID=70993 RepID=UPI00037AB608|nr:zinc-dependent metalloprotease [Flexithrix dorotheae]
MNTTSIIIILICFLHQFSFSQKKKEAPKPEKTIANHTAGMQKFSGFFDFYWDENKGKIWLEIGEFNTEFLYVNSLTAGVGSNDIGLDRNQLGSERVVKFEKIGPKVLLIQPNYKYRAISDNPEERKAVEEAFAQSVLWGFEVDLEENGKVLVDATKFFFQDAHDVAGRLKRSNQGSYQLNESRSAMYLPGTKSFPKNSEFEAILTFVGKPTGGYIRSVTPTPGAVTVRQHHSFVELPDDNYEKRAFDPRSGYYPISYMDYATPISEPILKQFIVRHRLKKKDPNAAVSEAVEPIIYYLDRGAPEPIKSALIEGAAWWNQAFEAIGYKDAFQVKLLPEDADPMDVRYNLINWVHRSTRGWSYGSSVVDPRTGEIIKGHVLLGSLRVRQDFLIAEGLLAPYEEGKPVSKEMEEMALARLRQLSAHEVGHTIGLMHNFAASPKDRASVMDYPHPYFKLKGDGRIDLSEAYAVGIGDWDKVTIAYGYQDFPEGKDDKEELDKIISNYINNGFTFISDADARPTGGAHPTAHLWDNGEDAVEELNRLMEIRAKLLADFSEKNIRNGAPMATLEESLVPVYMMHRYQVEAVSKILGGLQYSFAIKGDGQVITEMVPAEAQEKALEALLKTLTPEALAIPEELIQKIPPRPVGYPRSRETFKSRNGVTFDPVAAAESAAQASISLLLHPERAGRLVEFHDRNNDLPGFEIVVEKLIKQTFSGDLKKSSLQKMTAGLLIYELMNLSENKAAHYEVRAIAMNALIRIKDFWISRNLIGTNPFYAYITTEISRFLENPSAVKIPQPVSPPDGSPIGMDKLCGWK